MSEKCQLTEGPFFQWARLQKALKKESPLLEQAARFALATGLRGYISFIALGDNTAMLESFAVSERRSSWCGWESFKLQRLVRFPCRSLNRQ